MTFLFTDIEGSTRLVQALGSARYRDLLSEHSTILRTAVSDKGGLEFGTEGDAHFFVFARALDAMRAAVDAQRALASHDWPADAKVQVRIGIHTGQPERHGANYVGVDLNRVARIAAAGHGGQVLTSDDARMETGTDPTGPADDLDEIRYTDLGRHRLKDLVEPEHLYQVVALGLREEFPPIRSIDTRPRRLPAQVTSFIGRGKELREIGELMARSRLVTLTGPGGSGKTRLALTAADRLLPRFDDGVFFVALAPIDDPKGVPAAIAASLDVRETPERPILEVVEDHLRDKKALLVIDNVEHLTAGSSVIATLLEAAPAISVVATSRELLHLYGENEYPVPPLPVPGSADATEPVDANPCVQLFAERAAAVRPDFRLAANLNVVAEICRRVDGLPLAVELAAARVRILSPSELLAKLDRRLSTLTGGGRNLPERQQTLRATIDWSYDLLQPEESRLFARLAVFAGGWTREAAEAICAGDLGIDVSDGLESLVDKSLVQRIGGADGIRFGMLETIRDYGRERLEAAEDVAAVRTNHAAFFERIARSAEPNLTGPESATWLAALGLEVPNVRAALRWALDAGGEASLEVGLRTAGALWRFWQLTGALREAADWLEQLLAHPSAAASTAARAAALRGAGGIAYWRNDLPGSRALYEESVAIYRELGDRAGTAAALNDLAYLPMLQGELEVAQRLFVEARDLFRELGDAWQAALAEMNIASVRFFAGDYEEARSVIEAVVPTIRKRGDRFWLTEAITGLGQLEQLTGRLDAARRHYAEALQLALDAGTLAQVAMVLEPLSNLDAAEGEYVRATTLWAAAQAIKDRVGGGAPAEMMQTVDPRPAAVESLGEVVVDEAWAEGSRMTSEEAVAFAIGGKATVGEAPRIGS